jgi:predicted glycoside hydrolase/deacetylase ChbG (UPF0249 family)
VEQKQQSNGNGAGHRGLLILNADDWGRDTENTQRIYECSARNRLSSVSAMVFMRDSERASHLAREQGIDAGLHANLTTPFTAKNCPSQVADRQNEIVRYLKGSRIARVVFNPLLRRQFEYVVAAQIDEFRRLYGSNPVRIDGHHHMHLCANVLLGRLLPEGIVVRRNFSFAAGEKGRFNRSYRRLIDGLLMRRYRVTDYFFSLPPLQPESRLERIFGLSRDAVVEVETHPVNQQERRFLLGDEFIRLTREVRVAQSFDVAGVSKL